MNNAQHRGRGPLRQRRGIARPDLWAVVESRRRDERGFTLIELCIVMVILPIVVGALTVGLLSIFSLQSSVASRLTGSEDNQIVNAAFSKDVESATTITTFSSSLECGPATGYTQLLGLVVNSGAVPIAWVSYATTLIDNQYSLVRLSCATAPGPLQTVASTTTISSNILPTLTYVSVCTTSVSNCSGDAGQVWNTAALIASNVAALELTVQEATFDKYVYTLNAVPELSKSTATGLGLVTNGPTCGFGLPNTGTYASTLCFVNFNPGNGVNYITSAESATSHCSAATGGGQGVTVSAAVPGGYTMLFCLSIALGHPGDVIEASTFPTWPGAFLGNDINGTPFYSGVGCPDTDPTTYTTGGVTYGTTSCISPSIYENTSGALDTVTASNIVVTDPQGTDATGYAVVTADAETTDPSESLTWTSSLPSGSPFVFNQVPDTSSSPEGDACNETGQTGATGQAVDNGTGLTGVGTDQVECISTWQSSGQYPRTGTVILDVLPTTTGGVTAPVTISAQMQGAGLEGVAFGLLLP